MRGTCRRALVALAACAIIAVLVPAAAGAKQGGGGLKRDWQDCGDVGAQCATATVPKDYGSPGKGTLKVAVSKIAATGKKEGSLFFNFGGPGAPAAIYSASSTSAARSASMYARRASCLSGDCIRSCKCNCRRISTARDHVMDPSRSPVAA